MSNKYVKPVCITTGVIAGLAGIYVVVKKVIKEVRAEVDAIRAENADLSDELDVAKKDNENLNTVININEAEIVTLKTNLQSAVFDDVDVSENGELIKDPELERMAKRLNAHLDEKTSASVTKSVTHNIWEERPSIPVTDEEDVPLSRFEKPEEKVLEEKEVTEMRYDPNSLEAWEAYRNMSLADLRNDSRMFIVNARQYGIEAEMDFDNVRNTMIDLFQISVPYIANEYDENIAIEIVESRRQFFGDDSVYTQGDGVSFAEVMLYFAERLEVDYEIPLFLSLTLFLDNLDFNNPTYGIEDINATVFSVIEHRFVFNRPDGSTTFGMFGLPYKVSMPTLQSEYNAFESEINKFYDEHAE